MVHRPRVKRLRFPSFLFVILAGLYAFENIIIFTYFTFMLGTFT